jgi:hypothetical protein
MEHMLSRMMEDFLARDDGPLSFRLILQPAMAALLAILAGLRDRREGRTPYFWAVVSDPTQRRHLLWQGWKDVGKVFILAVILDVIYQLLVHGSVYPGETLIVAILLAIVPYLVLRGVTTRLLGRRPAEPSEPGATPAKRRSASKRVALAVLGLLLIYLAAAYLVLPGLWKRYAHRHPSLEDVPGITHTADGIPGDPLNVALIGTKAEVLQIMLAAKWHPADPLTLRSCLEIAEASVFKRSYDDAPVSSLYLFGRKQDLAFEQPVGPDPRHRHHVRFWLTEKRDPDGRPVWVGSAVYDKRVGLSHTTGQVTHVTAADVDAERDYLFRCLEETGDLAERYVIADFHKTREGRNGGGDPWHTDGSLYVGVIAVQSTR